MDFPTKDVFSILAFSFFSDSAIVFSSRERIFHNRLTLASDFEIPYFEETVPNRHPYNRKKQC